MDMKIKWKVDVVVVVVVVIVASVVNAYARIIGVLFLWVMFHGRTLNID
ncbi:hypothetical protein C5167_021503 [Papaver somniferum]|nr:hypothetical protein C5167_021503 [Papaver somniferum]